MKGNLTPAGNIEPKGACQWHGSWLVSDCQQAGGGGRCFAEGTCDSRPGGGEESSAAKTAAYGQ